MEVSVAECSSCWASQTLLVQRSELRLSSLWVSLRKRRKAGTMTDNKTKPTKLSVAAFIDALTDETKRTDAKALVKLMQSATGEKAEMWGPSIIGFGRHHYTDDTAPEGNTPLPGFSPPKS